MPKNGRLISAELLVGELLQGLDVPLVGGQGVGGLLVGVLGVPDVPDGLEASRLASLALAEGAGQHQQPDLGAAAQVRQDLGDAPVPAVGLTADLLGGQRPDETVEPFVRAPQGGDPLARV